MYPDAQTTIAAETEHDFTTIDYQEIETMENIELETVLESDCTTGSEPSSTETSGTVASRRHRYPAWLPILTLLRYTSTIGLTEIIITSFTNASVHHSAVSNLS